VVFLGSVGFTQVPAVEVPAAADGEYVLQAGDDVSVRAYNLPQLDTDARIRPDGKISLLLLDDVQAAGLTPRQLSWNLTRGFSTHFRNPKVTVIVRNIAAQSVYVGGEVAIPSAIPVRGSMGAVQAVVSAGGSKENASDEVVIVHKTPEGPKRETVSVREVVQGTRPDPVIGPSDTVYVQKSLVSVYVGGEVAKPGLVPLTGSATVLTAVFQAGGLRPTAKTDEIILLRDSGNHTPTATKISLNDVFTDAPHTKLQPYDVVFVPKSRIAKVDQWIDQWVRQLSPATLSLGFSYLFGIAGSGGTVPF
jgi:protein involved in polysaccharide export with SLBB domain